LTCDTHLSQSSLPLELRRIYAIVETTPDRIVEPFDIIERICSALVSGAIRFPRNAFGARSAQLQTMQLAAISCWNFPLVCWLP